MSTGVITWPPENPTATTPSSLPAERNLGEIVEGEVIIVSLESCRCRMIPKQDNSRKVIPRIMQQENRKTREETNKLVRTVGFILGRNVVSIKKLLGHSSGET